MRRLTGKLILVGLLLVGGVFDSGIAKAESKGQRQGKSGIGLPTQKAILERQIGERKARSGKSSAPVSVEGTSLHYDQNTKTYIITGAAKVVQGGTTLNADKIFLSRKMFAHAVGHVRLVDPSAVVEASEARVDFSAEKATLYNAKVFGLNRRYYLTGEKMEKFAGQHYHGEQATLTTCVRDGPQSPDWSIAAKDLDLHLGDAAVVHGGRFNILGYPVIPLPYAKLDIDSDRHSGFLTPQVSYSTLRSFQVIEPYFVNISESQDASAALNVESAARIGGLFEYRLANSAEDYLQFTTSFFNESIRSDANRRSDLIDPQIADPTMPLNRWGFVGVMEQHITPSLFAYADAFSSGDSMYFREMNQVVLSGNYGWNTGIWQTARDAISKVGLIQEFDNSFIRLGALWNQDLIAPQEFALQTLPQLLWSGRQNIANGLAYLDFDTSAVNFWRQTGVDGLRFDLNPRLTVPWAWDRFLTGWATVGADEAVYDVSGQQVRVLHEGTHGLTYNNSLTLGRYLANGGLMSRFVPELDVGLKTALVGISDANWLGIHKIENLMEPFVEYNYSPKVGQGDLPLFDEIDRIEPRSLVFYGVTSRIFIQTGDTTGRETQMTNQATARGFLGPSFTTAGGRTDELLRFSLQQAYDTSNTVTPDGSHFSDLAFQLSLFPTRVVSAGTEAAWSLRPEDKGLDEASVYLLFQPPWQTLPNVYTGRALQGSFFLVSYTYANPAAVLLPPSTARNNLSAVNLRTYVDLFNRLGLYFEPSYDVATSRLLSAVFGIRVKSSCDCWYFDFAVNRSYYPSDTAFTWQITLGGLGSMGGSPFGYNPFQLRGLIPVATRPQSDAAWMR